MRACSLGGTSNLSSVLRRLVCVILSKACSQSDSSVPNSSPVISALYTILRMVCMALSVLRPCLTPHYARWISCSMPPSSLCLIKLVMMLQSEHSSDIGL